ALRQGRVNEGEYEDLSERGAYGATRRGTPEQRLIVLNTEHPHEHGNYVQTLLHEAIHHVAGDYIERMERFDPDHKELQVLNEIGAELAYAARAAHERGEQFDKSFLDQLDYAQSSPHEMHTMLLTNPE